MNIQKNIHIGPVNSYPHLCNSFFLICSLLILALTSACNTDSRPIVFISERGGIVDIYSAYPNGDSDTNLTNNSEIESSPILSPNGKLIAFQSGTGNNATVEVMSVDGIERRRVSKRTGTILDHQWAPGSERIAYVMIQNEIPVTHIVKIDGSEHVKLTSISTESSGDWSQDGSSLVFAVSSGENRGLWIRNPDGVNEIQVTETPDYNPIWSPDSKRIAFLSTRDGNPEIYIMNADGTEPQKLTETNAPEYNISWSPNGKKILYVSEKDGNPEIYVAKVSTLEHNRLTFNNARDDQPVWSPDGTKITFVSYLDDDSEIFVITGEGDPYVRLTNNDYEESDPSW